MKTSSPHPELDHRRATLWLAGILVVTGITLMAVIIPHFVRSPTTPRPLAMAPWMLPQIAAALLIASGATLALLALRGRASKDDPQAEIELPGLARGILVVIAFPVLLSLLGAVLAGVVTLFTLVATSPGQSLGRAGLVSLGVTGLAWLLFRELAGTPLPTGLFGIG